MLANNHAPLPPSLAGQQPNAADTAAACIRQALAFWSAGNFDACIDETGKLALNSHTSESIFIRARALLRVNRAADAEAWLRVMASRHSSEDALATHNMLLGNASARLSNFEHAATLFDRARSGAPHPTIVAETAYYHALALWQSREFRAARKALLPAVALKHDIVSVRSQQLLGFVAIAEGKFSEADTHFWSALESLSGCVARDSHLEATILHQLSISGAEVTLCDPERLVQRVRGLQWTANLVMEQVQTLRHIGLAYARLGESQSAIAHFIEAGDVMPKSPWAVIGYAEAANLCYSLNEPIGASAFLRTARFVADHHVRWQSVDKEGRLALLQLAMVVARSGDGTQARVYLDLYEEADRLGVRLPTLSALNLDLRLECFENHARGVVHRALNLPDAFALLSAVALSWRRLKYDYRSAEARDDVRTLTHRSYAFAKPGERRSAECAPPALSDDRVHSNPIATDDRNRVSARVASAVPKRTSVCPPELMQRITITERQDAIIRLLVMGCSIEDIASELGLQPKTVRNHLSNLYVMFGVDGQLQLVATIWSDPALRESFAVASGPQRSISRIG